MKNDKPLLIVVSKAKELMKESNISISQEALEALSEKLANDLKLAGEEAKKHKRKVIKARDLPK